MAIRPLQLFVMTVAMAGTASISVAVPGPERPRCVVRDGEFICKISSSKPAVRDNHKSETGAGRHHREPEAHLESRKSTRHTPTEEFVIKSEPGHIVVSPIHRELDVARHIKETRKTRSKAAPVHEFCSCRHSSRNAAADARHTYKVATRRQTVRKYSHAVIEQHSVAVQGSDYYRRNQTVDGIPPDDRETSRYSNLDGRSQESNYQPSAPALSGARAEVAQSYLPLIPPSLMGQQAVPSQQTSSTYGGSNDWRDRGEHATEGYKEHDYQSGNLYTAPVLPPPSYGNQSYGSAPPASGPPRSLVSPQRQSAGWTSNNYQGSGVADGYYSHQNSGYSLPAPNYDPPQPILAPRKHRSNEDTRYYQGFNAEDGYSLHPNGSQTRGYGVPDPAYGPPRPPVRQNYRSDGDGPYHQGSSAGGEYKSALEGEHFGDGSYVVLGAPSLPDNDHAWPSQGYRPRQYNWYQNGGAPPSSDAPYKEFLSRPNSSYRANTQPTSRAIPQAPKSERLDPWNGYNSHNGIDNGY